MGSSPQQRETRFVAALAVLLACAACNPGTGVGMAMGDIAIASCHDGTRAYDLQPSFYSAEGTLDALHIRIQRGSDVTDNSDGIFIDLQDAAGVYTALKGMAAMGVATPSVTIPVGDPASASGVSLTLYLNGSCQTGFMVLATVLPSTSGTVTFTAIYSPTDPSSTTQITGHFDDVVFEIAGDPTRRAQLSGTFDFAYNRGRPAQRYP